MVALFKIRRYPPLSGQTYLFSVFNQSPTPNSFAASAKEEFISPFLEAAVEPGVRGI